MGCKKNRKSTYLRERFPQSLVFDFLDTDLVLEFSKRPALLRDKLLARDASVLKHPIILDEVQKVPHIVDEVHWLVENKRLQFILCGSSARKLKRGQANLLGGRAWQFEMFPLMAFKDEYSPRQTPVVCNERVERIHERIRIVPWRVFLRDLWEGKIIG